MAELILRLRVDPATGKRELVIDYASEADALPMEHEEAHRQLADRVVEGQLSGGALEVTREAQPAAEAAPAEPDAAVAQPSATRR
jgi:hypothetical protein